MNRLYDKIILLFLCILLNISFSITFFSIIPILIVIIFSGYRYTYPNHKVNVLFLFIYILISCFYFDFLFYLSIMLYDWYSYKKKDAYLLLFLFPLCIQLFSMPILSLWIFLSFFPSVILKYRTETVEELQQVYLLQRDSTKELNLLMAQQNKDLIVRQDQEIHIATLNERNRIARDIHDTVGHLLSSSLLQIGAIQALNKQTNLTEPLVNIKNTLTSGLDSIRKSVHNMHNDAIDLEAELQKLSHEVTTCKTTIIYDLSSELPLPYTYHIIAIVKEALTNIMKHSNADEVTLICREQPMFYQLIIHDNGTNIHLSENGIGLKNMQDRVEHMHGYFNYHVEHGFEIFITIPKESTL